MTTTEHSNSIFSLIAQELKEAYRYRYVTYSFVETNLKLRYRRSSLGFIWTVLAPMLHYIVIGLMFSLIMGSKRPDYFVYYFSGALFFAIISGVMNRAPNIFISNEHFIKKIYIPKLTFVLNAVCIEATNFFLSASSLILLGVLLGKFHLSIYLPMALIPVLMAAVTLLGVSCLISVLSVYFRDFQHIMPVALQALFFATPIVYDETMIPEQYHWIMTYNPISYFLKMFRQPLLEQTLPSFQTYLSGFIFSVIILILGLWIVKKFDNKIVFKL